jgi:hypothetical protein
LKLFIRFQVLLLSALFAHILAGGTLVETPNLIWQGIAIGSLLFGMRSIKLEGPSLALEILLIQSTSHFVVGGGTYLNELRMTWAHTLSGIISYFAISYFELALNFIASVFGAIIPAKSFIFISVPEVFSCTSLGSGPTYQIRQLFASLNFRGPPVTREN